MQAPPPHRTAHGAARVQALADTAAEMFLEQGYASVSIDELIARVGGSRRNVYAHFGGKEGLFIEAVTRLCDEISAPLLKLDISASTVREGLAIFGRNVVPIVLQPRTLALHRLMIAEGQRFPELSQAALRAGHDNAARLLGSWIETRPEFRGGVDAALLADQFLTMLVSPVQLRALVGLVQIPLTTKDIEAMVDLAVSTFLNGALASAKGNHA